MFQYDTKDPQAAEIKVMGVGGGGGNAVDHMMNANIQGVEYICVNTDAQVLSKMGAKNTIQIGSEITNGLGAGTNPDVGRQAAQEDRDHIHQVISGADMLFLTAGMGGGTGTGAIPVIASIAKDLGVLTVAVVTKPFPFEGGKRKKVAEDGLVELRQHVDSLIVVPNEKLLTNLPNNVTMLQAFKAANDVLKNAVQGIAEIITNPGLINVDFADVKSVMSEMGQAMMGTGSAHGEDRAADAARAATESPLLDDINLKGARGIICNITAGADLSIREYETVGDVLAGIASTDANVVIGTSINSDMEGEIRVTVVASGLEGERVRKPMRVVRSSDGRQSLEATPASAGARGADIAAQAGFSQYEKPAVERASRKVASKRVVQDARSDRERGHELPRKQRVSRPDPVSYDNSGDGEMTYLDLPTFLRKQAD